MRRQGALLFFFATLGCGDDANLVDATAITGRLFEASTGNGLFGRITVSPDLGEVTTSSATGSFRIDGAAFGTRYRVVGEANGFLAAEAQVVPRPDRPATVELGLEPAIACLAGEARCARGGVEGIETCTADGRGFVFQSCGAGEVCTDGPACVGAPEVRVSVTGAGSVVSQPSGLLCNPTCNRSFPVGTQVMLEARSFGDSEFLQWGGACAGTEPTCVVDLTGDVDVTASFRTTAFRLSASVRGGAGSITSDPAGISCGNLCQAFFPAGQQVALMAVPGPDRELDRWENDCASAGRNQVCTLTLDQARTVGARFRTPGIPLEVTLEGGGTGVVTSDPSGIDCGVECLAGFDNNQRVTLTAAPAPLSRFAGWGGDCAPSGMMTECSIQMSQARNVSARFEGDTSEVTVSLAGGAVGTVVSTPAGIDCGAECTARFPTGQSLQLDATPGPDAVFFGWTGACAGTTGTSCTLTPAADVTVGARFEPFYLAPLPQDADCLRSHDFEPPAPLAAGCGAGPATASGWTSVPGRSTLLGQAYSAGAMATPIQLGAPALTAVPATVELSARPQSPGTLYSDHDRRVRAGLEVRALAGGAVSASSYDGAGAASSATTAAGALASGAWGHVAVVLDPATGLRILIDGQVAAADMGPLRFTASSSTAWVGAARTGTVATDTWSGEVDALRISNTARY